MELLDGGSLKELLQREPLTWARAVEIALQIAQALTLAHARGIIHRDIKPGNIMFDLAGHAKLTDFGLAHLDDASSLTQMGTVIGTVFYLSPEQAAGRPVDGRSDLYALGAVLFEMLVGQPPFTGTSAVGIIQKHLTEAPRPIREFDADLPRSLERVVERLLDKEPDRRYDNAQQLIVALQAVLAQDEADAAPAVFEAENAIAATSTHDLTDALPLTGRDEEWELMERAFQRALAGAGQALILAGEAGAGKSRLLSEMLRAAARRGALYLSGACVYSDAPNPYAPLAEMLQSYIAGEGVQAAERLAPAERDRLDELLDDICPVLNVPRPSARDRGARSWLRESSPRDARAQVFEALLQFFLLAAQARPLVVAIDDLQWASPTTLQFFHYLARSVPDAQILLLACYRPEDVMAGPDGQIHPVREMLARLYRDHLADEVMVGPLSESAVALLSEHYLDIGLDPEVGQRLWQESEGNPLYLIELLSLLDEQGLLPALADGGDPAFDAITIPATVRDTIMRRVERLTPDDRDLLDWAAVSGPRIDVAAVAAAVGKSRLVIMRQLMSVERYHGLVRAEERAFIFAHTRIQQVLYEELPQLLSAEYHLALAEAIEARLGGESEGAVYELARHYVRGGEEVKGYHYLCEAARKAESAYAAAEAAQYWAQALDLAAAVGAMPTEEAEGWQHHGRLLLTMGRHDDAETSLRRALDLAVEVSDQGRQASVLLDLSTARGRVGDWDAAVKLGGQSEQMAAEIGDGLTRARALLTSGFFAFEHGQWEPAMQRLDEAARLAAEAGGDILQARAWGNMAILHSARGDLASAIALYEQANTAFEAYHDLLDQGRVLNNLGFAHQQNGEFDAALSCYRQALNLLARVGDVREQGLVHLHMAEVALRTEVLDDAREHCVQANRRFLRIGFEPGMADVDRVYAGIATHQKRWPVAEHYLREALAVYESYGDQLNIAETQEELGLLLEQVGEGARAAEALERSRSLYHVLRGDVEDA